HPTVPVPRMFPRGRGAARRNRRPRGPVERAVPLNPARAIRGTMPDETPPIRVLAQIDSRTWEHPADRAALNALRRLPAFDEVLRRIFGFFGEKPIRLAFQA